VQAGTQAEQVRIFFAKRVDVIVIDLTIFKWYQAQSAKDFDGQSESLTYHPIFKSGTGFAVAFTNKALRDRFNLTLQQMRLDGSYQKILAKYQ
jgi:polar amino acid transport system substrate-binding protein